MNYEIKKVVVGQLEENCYILTINNKTYLIDPGDEAQKIEEKNSYDASDIIADLYACAISDFGGNFTPEMKKICDEIKSEENITEEQIYNLASNKIITNNSYLPIIHKERVKGIFGEIKNQIEFLKLENKNLENQIILERGKSQFETFNKGEKNIEVIIPKNVKKA